MHGVPILEASLQPAGRSWVDDRPLTPVVLHARSATASRLSHKTYNKYREPLFNFGCISTKQAGNARERADPLKSAPS